MLLSVIYDDIKEIFNNFEFQGRAYITKYLFNVLFPTDKI